MNWIVSTHCPWHHSCPAEQLASPVAGFGAVVPWFIGTGRHCGIGGGAGKLLVHPH
ncbi:MAG TPA: hypothetical protein VH596_15200 [Terriglobales bacterium]